MERNNEPNKESFNRGMKPILESNKESCGDKVELVAWLKRCLPTEGGTCQNLQEFMGENLISSPVCGDHRI